MTKPQSIGCICSILFGSCFATLCPAREFGPEWRKIMSPNTGRFEYHKEIKVSVVHFGGNVANYEVALESDRLQIVEMDDNQGFFVESPSYGRFEVKKNRDGSATWYRIRFSKVQYYDYNGDGVLDVMV